MWNTHADLDQLNDRDLILAIYRRLSRMMFQIAGKYTDQPRQLEEIVQESLVRLMEKTQLLRELSDEAIAAYVAATVRHTAINLCSRKTEQTSPVEDLPEQADSAPSLDELLIRKEQVERFRSIWPQLDEETRYLLESKYVLEYDDARLAQELRCKPASVRMKLTRARRRAMKMLKESGFFDED